MVDPTSTASTPRYVARIVTPPLETVQTWVEPQEPVFQPSPKAIAKDYERQWSKLLPGGKGACRVGIICDDEQAMQGPDAYIRYFTRAVIDSKAQPVFLFPSRDPFARQMRHIDALLVPGGADVDPSFYGAERSPRLGRTWPEDDAFALACIQDAYAKEMPMFGICRGMQLMNVAANGTLVQDIPTEFHGVLGNSVDHRPGAPQAEPGRSLARAMPAHDMILLDPTSELHRLLGTMCIGISSLHHQCVGVLGPMLRTTAIAPDGVVEAVERRGMPTQFGVQGHPELTRKVDPRFQNLFDYLVENGTRYRVEHHHTKAAPPASASPGIAA